MYSHVNGVLEFRCISGNKEKNVILLVKLFTITCIVYHTSVNKEVM